MTNLAVPAGQVQVTPGISNDWKSALIEMGIQAGKEIIIYYAKQKIDNASQSQSRNKGKDGHKARFIPYRQYWPRRRKFLQTRNLRYRRWSKTTFRWNKSYQK